MYNSKIMKKISADQIQPSVRIANYIQPKLNDYWGYRIIADLELVLVVSGHYEYETTDKPIQPVRAGDVLVIFPGERHTLYRRDQDDVSIISCIHCELTPHLSWGASEYQLTPYPEQMTRADDPVYIERLFKQCSLYFNGYHRRRNILADTICREIWLLLAENWERSEPLPCSTRMDTMLCYIREHIEQPLSRKNLADVFHLTPQHINALFKKELDATPTEIIHRERVALAYRLMHEKGLNVSQAGYAAGFSDPFYFSRIFKKYMGYAPARYLSFQRRRVN